MGKVFSPEELRAGQVPISGAHTAAVDFIVEQLFAEHKAFGDDPLAWIETDISAGLVHGSATHGTANVRSDVDTLVILRSMDPSTLDVIRAVFNEAQVRFKVPIETNVLSLDDVSEKTHRIDPIFLRYLYEAEANPKYSWNWPASDIGLYFDTHDYEPISLARVNQRYAAAKSASFAKALTLGGEDDLHRLQRALELPKNIGRKILGMCDPGFSAWSTSTEDILSGLDTFIGARAFTHEHEYGNDLKDLLQRLLGCDAEYNHILSQAISGEISIDTYSQWVETSKQDIFLQALGICSAMQSVLRRYVRELRSDDWETTKAEIEQRIAEVDISYWDDAY